MKNVSVLIGAGSIGEAIIRRIATGHIVSSQTSTAITRNAW